MPKSPALEQKDFARNSLIEATGRNKVGNFIEAIEEEPGVVSFIFENNQKGYVGWRWSITIFQAIKSEPATVSEIVLIAGPDSLVAPDWVPWSERLADYKALQIELEKQAALDAEEDSEDSDESEDQVEDLDESDDDSDQIKPAVEELSVSDSEEGEDAEDDAEDTGRKPPRFLRRRKGLKIKKARGKGKNPQD